MKVSDQQLLVRKDCIEFSISVTGFMSPHGSEWHDASEYTYTAEDNSMQDDLNTGQLLDILGIVSNNMDVQM